MLEVIWALALGKDVGLVDLGGICKTWADMGAPSPTACAGGLTFRYSFQLRSERRDSEARLPMRCRARSPFSVVPGLEAGRSHG